jgi:DNA polymerase-3 subunit alpha
MALYRPSTMNTGYTQKFLDRRFKKEAVDYPHEMFETVLEDTLGLVVYQEQVLQILRILGLPDDNLNQFLSAIKVKHGKGGYSDASTKTFEKNRQLIYDLCLAKGLNKIQADEVWEMMQGFHAYGFNKAHAVAYGVLGYQTAYMKTHFPLYYMSALLETTVGTPKEKEYIKEAQRLGIKIKAPDVNKSNVAWTLDQDGIRKGLMSIDGIGVSVANQIAELAPYHSFEDMIARVPARALTGASLYKKDGTLKGTAEKLRKAGALRSLGLGRFS